MVKSARSKFERNLDWNLLKVFDEIVRCGGVSRAATSLCRQQPSVSGALKRLEDSLGVTLCRRGPAGFELTDEGEMVAAIAGRIHGAVSELTGCVGQIDVEPRGQFRIVMVQNLVCDALDQAIVAFTRQFPRAEVIIRNVLLPEVQDLISDGQAEIGVAPVVPDRRNLAYDFLYREQHRPFCGRDYPLFGKIFVDGLALADEIFVLPDVEEAEIIRDYRHRHGWGRRHAGRSPYLLEVKRMVVAGLGIAMLPEEMLKTDIATGTLWPLMAPQVEAKADVFVISNPSAPKTLATTHFLSILAETLGREASLTPSHTLNSPLSMLNA